jgi:hypothetical protein
MARELVSKRELIRILNNELSKYEECKDCHFDGVMKYEKEKGNGCNWLGANVKFRCSDKPDKRCQPFISKVLSEAGKQYNIKK